MCALRSSQYRVFCERGAKRAIVRGRGLRYVAGMSTPESKQAAARADNEIDALVGAAPRRAPPTPEQLAKAERAGRSFKILMVVGMVLTFIGLIVGFTAMFIDADSAAVMFIGIIPVGFLMTFGGLTGWVLAGGR